ncbi:unnamed protein product [Mytilus coruscus]|uniref:Uncharacterized protein n=1 Tax=Mytilus coruscus TaxID=42192 RepID=A0A6J8A8L0_MYTCO|nr:unnamed protein product [Mytilus coruscus]
MKYESNPDHVCEKIGNLVKYILHKLTECKVAIFLGIARNDSEYLPKTSHECNIILQHRLFHVKQMQVSQIESEIGEGTKVDINGVQDRVGVAPIEMQVSRIDSEIGEGTRGDINGGQDRVGVAPIEGIQTLASNLKHAIARSINYKSDHYSSCKTPIELVEMFKHGVTCHGIMIDSMQVSTIESEIGEGTRGNINGGQDRVGVALIEMQVSRIDSEMGESTRGDINGGQDRVGVAPIEVEMIEKDAIEYMKKGEIIQAGSLNARDAEASDYIENDSDKHLPLYESYNLDTSLLHRLNQDKTVCTTQSLCISSDLRILNGSILGDLMGKFTCHQTLGTELNNDKKHNGKVGSKLGTFRKFKSCFQLETYLMYCKKNQRYLMQVSRIDSEIEESTRGDINGGQDRFGVAQIEVG